MKHSTHNKGHCIILAQDRDQGRALVNTVMNQCLP
jgi:hypothetical protein